MQATLDDHPHPPDRLLPARLVGALVALVGAWMLLARDGLRDAEASLVADVVGLVLRLPASGLGHSGLFSVDDEGPALFRITGECSIAPLVGGVVLLAGLLLALRGDGVARLLGAAAVACGVIVAVNQVRMLMIVFAYATWGETGFRVTHVYVGSMLILAGLVFAVVVFLRLTGWSRRSHRPQPGRR